MNKLKALVLAAATLILPLTANAQLAYTARTVPLHAGPAADYPVVAILEGGLALTVQGCLQDYSWCDVAAGANRGWVYAPNIKYFYRGATVPVINYAAAFGIGVVTFVIGNYWQDHYVSRPWYRQLPQWRQRPARAAIHPRPPHRTAHPGEWQRPAPAYRPLQRPPIAGLNPPPPREAARAGAGQRPMAASRTLLRPPIAGASPRPAQTRAHPGREQSRTPGPARGARHRP